MPAELTIKIPGQIPRKYPLPDSWTYRELQTIKRIAGCTPVKVMQALEEGDPDAIMALAVVVANRAGHNLSENDLLDLEMDSVSFEGADDDESPMSAGSVVEATMPATIPAHGGTPDSSESTDSDPEILPI